MEYTVTSPQLVTKTQDIVVWSHVLSGGSTFAGVFFKSYLLHKYQIKQELALYRASHTYKMLVPDNNPGSYFKYFSPVAVIIFTTLNYRALLRVYRIGGLQVRGGLALDFDFVRTPYEMPPYYAPDYPAAIELEKLWQRALTPSRCSVTSKSSTRLAGLVLVSITSKTLLPRPAALYMKVIRTRCAPLRGSGFSS